MPLATRSVLAPYLLPLALLVSAAPACSDEGSPSKGPDANRGPDVQDVLRDLANVVIVPAYDDFRASAEQLEAATRSLCAAPDAAQLTALRGQWRDTRALWKRAEAHEFGPAADLRIDTAVDFWPVRASSVDIELAKTDPVPEDYATTLGDTLKGLPVMEYILYDGASAADDADTESVLARLVDAETGEPTRTCAYLVALSVDVHAKATTLYQAWAPEGENFAAELATAGQGSTAYPDRAKAVSAVVNDFVYLIQEVESVKLAEPLGKRAGDVPQPDAVESARSDSSRADIAANLAGVRAVYTCTRGDTTGASFQAAVAALNPELDAAIMAQLDDADAKVAAIALPLERAVVEDAAPVEAAFESTKELFRLMAVDMVNLLGVTLNFSDNDGD